MIAHLWLILCELNLLERLCNKRCVTGLCIETIINENRICQYLFFEHSVSKIMKFSLSHCWQNWQVLASVSEIWFITTLSNLLKWIPRVLMFGKLLPRNNKNPFHARHNHQTSSFIYIQRRCPCREDFSIKILLPVRNEMRWDEHARRIK